jgi:hypothetical protein
MERLMNNIGNDVEGRGRGLILGTIKYFATETKKHQEEYQSRQ